MLSQRFEDCVGRSRRLCIWDFFPKHKVNSRRCTVFAKSHHAIGHRAIQNGKRSTSRTCVDAAERTAFGAPITHYAASLYVCLYTLQA